jgi:hypothetical protein
VDVMGVEPERHTGEIELVVVLSLNGKRVDDLEPT